MGAHYSVNDGADPSATRLTQFSQEELQLLLSSTNYSPEEIYHLRAQFLSDVPHGLVSYPMFDAAATLFGIRDSVLREMLFRAFDANADGVISFFEFSRAMSIMTRGSNMDKVLFAFDMYDVNKEGVLKPELVLPILCALEESFGKFKTYDGKPELLTAKDILNRMFPRNAQTMTRDLFREFALVNSSVVKGLALTPN
jgi:Ca2+-binding EF-hand superfamily protein